MLAAIALPPSLLTTCNFSQLREIHLIHHADDRLCVWNPSNHDIKLLRQRGFKITHITGWRAYLGTAQHNYSHWTRVALPEGRPDMEQLEGTPGVLPFEVYSQAPLRLISWCSFELPRTARKLLRELAEMCELPETTTQALVTHIAAHNSEVKTEQEATQYLATLATVTISSRTKLLNYTTMVQHFLGTLQLPLAVYMLDYYLPMLSPNEGYNETGLTMQSAGPIRQPSQPIALEFLFKGSEFGHWKVKGGQDAFAFRHPSLGKTEVFSLLASDAHHHKVSPIGTGRLIAMVGTADALAYDGDDLQILFGLVLAITPRAAKKKDELAASRIYRQCNPKFIEVAFLSGPAIEFFAKEQLEALQDLYSASGQHLDPIDATVQGQKSPVPQTFFRNTMWMFGCTKPTRELTAFFFPPVWPIRTRLGPYNCVSSEKQKCTRTRVVQKLWQIITKPKTNKKKQQNHHNQKRPANPPARFAFRVKSRQRSNKERGRAQQNKKHIQICLRYSDLSHRIILKNMQTNYPLRQCVKYSTSSPRMSHLRTDKRIQCCRQTGV